MKFPRVKVPGLTLGGTKAATFGLDVGSSAVKVVAIRHDGAYTLTGLGVATLPPEAVVDGAIKDAAAVSAAIKDAVQRAGVNGTDVAISICGRELIVKKIRIPVVPQKELHDAVQLEAEHHIPFAIEEVFVDYHVVGQNNGSIDLILVAVKKSKVTEYVSVVEDAGLKAVVVDVDSFALGNQFELNSAAQPDEAVALIDIGASIMKTNVLRNGATIFARDIPFGGNQYTQAIAQRLSLPFEEAEAAKLGAHSSVDAKSVSPVIDEVSHELSLEVQRTFDYFASTAESERIAKIVLAGGCAHIAGLSDYLASTWGIPVEVARPFDRVMVEETYADAVAAGGPALAVAVGLGLRRPGDERT